MQHKTSNQSVSNLKTMQLELLSKVQLLASLNSEYRTKQQKQFLGTFLHIMNQMSNQLATIKQQYQNIDEQIQKDQQCMELSMKLTFFQNECLVLKDQLIKTQQKLEDHKNKQKQLILEKQILQSKLFRKSKQLFKYKAKNKAYSLQKVKQQNNNSNQKYNSNRTLTKIQLSQKIMKKQQQKSQTNATEVQKNSFRIQRQNNFSSTQNQFKQKAHKLAKQRKTIMNHTYFTSANNSNNNQPYKKSNFLTELLK